MVRKVADTIVIMTVGVSSLFVSIRLTNLVLCIVLFTSCITNEKSEKAPIKKDNSNLIHKKEKIEIKVNFVEEGATGLNIFDQKGFEVYPLEFDSNKISDTMLVRKIDNSLGEQIFFTSQGLIEKSGNLKIIRNNYFIDDSTNLFNFNFVNGTAKLINPTSAIIDYIYEPYSNFKSNLRKETTDLKSIKKEIINTYSRLNQKIITDDLPKSHHRVNELFYVEILSRINSNDEIVENYLKNLRKPIYCQELRGLIIRFMKGKAEVLDNVINFKNKDSLFIEISAKSVVQHLSFNKKNKKRLKYYDNFHNWLKGTNFYSKNSEIIDNELRELDSKKFKDYLKKLNLMNTLSQKNTLSNVFIQNLNNEFYLLDFWATWCAPCIEGVKTMNKMQLPNNVKVISISIDKEKDKEKWIKMTNNLEQSLSYWIDETDSDTKEFMKFIEMQSIPRYILIDKDMNLIDQSFYHPQEPQFLPKLIDVKNHKYW